MSDYDNIPDELKQRDQWLLWKTAIINGRKTKIPVNCDGKAISIKEPSNWVSFACAVECADRFDGIAYAFSENDPFGGIDIDDAAKHPDPDWQYRRQVEVYERFQSYTEHSPSGKGCHIIIKANIGKGVKEGALEIYTQERFFTMTGKVIRPLPINDYQDLALALKHDLRPEGDYDASFPEDVDQKESDEVIIERGKKAANGPKFTRLWEGDWRTDYAHKGNKANDASSEADCAFMNMLYWYTENHNQLKRIFLASGLCRDKYTGRHGNYYLNMLIALAADGKTKTNYDVSMIDWSAFTQQTAPEADGDTPEAASVPVTVAVQRDESRDALMDRIARDFKYEPPSGLLGQIAQFIYAQAPRPVAEIALGGAIGLMAGICGKAYNVSATGLNQYVLILAGTGTGKEAANSGINKLIQAVSIKVPTAKEFLGPSQIASQQALINYLDQNPCFLTVVGEFGLQLQQMSGPNAKDHQIGLRKIMLSLYNMSGNGNAFQPSIYADKEKNTKTLYAPNFSLLGESTPERFYEALSEDMIYEGFLPRFSIIEYKGDRPYPNYDHATAVPSDKLVNDLSSLCAGVKAAMSQNAITNVAFAPDALTLFRSFGDYADEKQRGSAATEFTKSLWSRCDVKAMKMAALIAVGRHYTQPLITLDAAEWAIGLALRDIRSLEHKFQDGEIGRANMSTDEQKQVDAIIRAIAQWMHNPFDTYSKYGGSIEMHNAHMIVAENVQRRVAPQTYFQKDRIGPSAALNRAFKTLCEWGYIEEVLDKKSLKETFGHSKRTFAIIDKTKFPVSLASAGAKNIKE